MPPRPRKSSACVTLVLIGAAALTGCGEPPSSNRRAAYATREACLADWGDPRDCEEHGPAGSRTWGPSTSTWHSYSGSSRGYSGSSRSSGSGARSGSSSSGGHSVSRGGFGSHGSSAS